MLKLRNKWAELYQLLEKFNHSPNSLNVEILKADMAFKDELQSLKMYSLLESKKLVGFKDTSTKKVDKFLTIFSFYLTLIDVFSKGNFIAYEQSDLNQYIRKLRVLRTDIEGLVR